LESNGGLQALRAFAASPDLSRQYQQAYTAAFGNGTAKNPGAVGATVNAAGKDLYGKQIDHIHNQIEKLRGDVKDVTKAINDKKKADDASRARHTAAGAKATAKELNSTAKKAKTR
jgi:citrate lyase gamma subunit